MRPKKDNKNTAMLLTKDSSETEIKAYFDAVLKLSQTGEEFPVNLNEVWPLVYSEKGKAVRALKESKTFEEGFDYQVFAINGKNPKGGRPKENIIMSVSAMEFFIARKVRPVFEVYRKVFHHTFQKQLEEPEKGKVKKPSANKELYLHKEDCNISYGTDGNKPKGKLLWSEEVTFRVDMHENICYNSVSTFVSPRAIREIKQIIDRMFYVVTGEMP